MKTEKLMTLTAEQTRLGEPPQGGNMQTKEIIDSVLTSAKTRAEFREHNLAPMPIGCHWWQGDVAIVRLASVPKELTALDRDLWPERMQLVPGTGIGSQHQVATKALSAIYLREGVLMGPVIVTGAEGATIEHPKHGWCLLPANSTFGIGYQKAFSPLGELRRQMD